MGGQGLYVWSAYLAAILVIATEIAVLALTRHSILEHLGRYAKIRRKQSRARDEQIEDI